MIAALYVDARGPYIGIDGVDPWTEERDARLYAGPHAVVAHPPCAPWSRLKHMCRRDPEGQRSCFAPALAAVRRWGGVLEHPAASSAFRAFGVPLPGELPDAWGGISIEVAQVEWGHVARKLTWLYLVGVAADVAMRRPPFPGRQPTHWCNGGRHRVDGGGGIVPDGIKVASAQQRRRTPPLFRDWLVTMARHSKVTR